MILGIAKIHKMLTVTVEVAHPLRVVEASLLKRTIYQAHPRASYRRNAFSGLLVNKHQTIVACICNHQQIRVEPLLAFNTQQFSRVPQVLLTGYLRLRRSDHG